MQKKPDYRNNNGRDVDDDFDASPQQVNYRSLEIAIRVKGGRVEGWKSDEPTCLLLLPPPPD